MKLGVLVFIVGALLIFVSIFGFYYALREADKSTVAYTLNNEQCKNSTLKLSSNTSYIFHFSADDSNIYYELQNDDGKVLKKGNVKDNPSFDFDVKTGGTYVLYIKNLGEKNNRVAIVIMPVKEYKKITNMMWNLEITLIVGAIVSVAGIAISLKFRV